MNELKLSLEELRNKIVLKNNWNNIKTTNCYAFALGLDINENDIINTKIAHAYNLGEFGKFKYNLNEADLDVLTFEERLFIDLDSLNINYEKVNDKELSLCNIDNDGCLTWMISLYEAIALYGRDFHFLRKNSDGYWIHKRGLYGNISFFDDDMKRINDLNNLYLLPFNNDVNYEQVGVYKLKLKYK